MASISCKGNMMHSAVFRNNFSKVQGTILGIIGDEKRIVRKNNREIYKHILRVPIYAGACSTAHLNLIAKMLHCVHNIKVFACQHHLHVQ